MPTIFLTCTYCDYRWQDYAYSEADIDKLKCPGCKDENIKVTKNKPTYDVFGYNYEDPNAPKKKR